MRVQITLVDNSNEQAVIDLQVRPSQKDFIETTAVCLAEANLFRLWRPVAIYVDGELVAFAMYGFFPDEGEQGRAWLDRLLVDGKHQGKGYAKPILQALIKRISSEYSCNQIFLSVYDNNSKAIGIYQDLGFVANGELDINGEMVMVLN